MRMDFAWRAADLVFSRSGAGTIAEAMEFEVPGIYVPYPHAADNHQESNAKFVVKAVGGGLQFAEDQLDAKKLAIEIEDLLKDDCKILKEMKAAIIHHRLGKGDRDLCSLIIDLCK